MAIQTRHGEAPAPESNTTQVDAKQKQKQKDSRHGLGPLAGNRSPISDFDPVVTNLTNTLTTIRLRSQAMFLPFLKISDLVSKDLGAFERKGLKDLTAFQYAGFIRTEGYDQLANQATEEDCKVQLMWPLLSPLSHIPHILKFSAGKQQQASDINPAGSVPDGLWALWSPALPEWSGGHNATGLDRLKIVRRSDMSIPILSYEAKLVRLKWTKGIEKGLKLLKRL
ncbi:unnamed protein product [Sympodiomycopsis kandeliae]